MNSILAPVVMFTYCRLANTKQTVEHLLMNSEAKDTDLIIYSDAPKNNNAEAGVRSTREYIHSISGFKSVTVIERTKNLGLANSIVDGVTTVINKYGKAIVLEDDLSVSPFFLKYMNEGLVRYEEREDIISIHGYIYPVKDKLPEAFLIRGADCWGWATWKRAWGAFCFDAQFLYQQIKGKHLEREFDYNFTYPYTDMLKKQIDGKANSWAVCWYATAFLNNKYTLYPGKSLVQLNDVEGTGSTHGSTPVAFLADEKTNPIDWDLVEDNSECLEARVAIENFFKTIRKRRYYIITLIKRVFHLS